MLGLRQRLGRGQHRDLYRGSHNCGQLPDPAGSTPGNAERSFVVKLDPNATTVIYMLFLGVGYAQFVAVDTSHSAYVTVSPNFPRQPVPGLSRQLQERSACSANACSTITKGYVVLRTLLN